MDKSLSEILDAYQVTAKWTKARNACHALFTASNDGSEGEYMDRMRVLQSVILTVKEKFMLIGIVPSVLKVCEIETDPRLQMQFLAAGYDLVDGYDYTTELMQWLSKQVGIRRGGNVLFWNFMFNEVHCVGQISKLNAGKYLQEDVQIRPMRNTDDIGAGAGLSIFKTFKGKSE